MPARNRIVELQEPVVARDDFGSDSHHLDHEGGGVGVFCTPEQTHRAIHQEGQEGCSGPAGPVWDYPA